PHEEKLPLDLFHREALAHEPADLVDLPNGGGRVEPLGASVLALAADAHAARQEAELDVLAERRLGQPPAPLGHEIDDLLNAEALGMPRLERRQVVLRPGPSLGRRSAPFSAR